MYRKDSEPRHREAFRSFVAALEPMAPTELDRELVELGYRGQETARRAVCLMAYRHIRRIIRLYRDHVPLSSLPSKANYLLMGPTGCGKTFLTELLFSEILRVPAVTVDVTAYSETGYVGQDPCSILTRLLHACGGNPHLAAIGVVCLDEFDKLSSGSNTAIFAGAGTTKDVTGRGVQRELLKMLEGADIEVPLELTHSSYSDRTLVSTRNVAFVACGAFSGFKTISRSDGAGPDIGFGRAANGRQHETIAVHLEQDEVERTVYFQSYGFMPELIGRFTRVVPFQPLGRETLMRILEDNVLHRFEREFSAEGIDLVVDSDVKEHIVSENLRKETGARGLASVLTRHIEDAAFHAFGVAGTSEVRLRWSSDGVVAHVDGSPREPAAD